MIGLVLCGGNSTRMGADKGLLKVDGETWAALAARKLQDLQLPVVLSINPLQYEPYGQVFEKQQLIVDNKKFNASAPLFGLLSVHLKFPEEDLFVLACDIKDMSTNLMQALQEQYQKHSGEAYVYHTGDRPQPLCGIYTATGLNRIYHLYLNGELNRYSMMHLLELVNTVAITVKEENRHYFNNYNTPEHT